MRKNIFYILLFISGFTFGQKKNFKNYIETSDVKRFWNAYDSIKTISDSTEKVKVFQDLYIQKGTKGLLNFAQSRDFTSQGWIDSFKNKPKFWNSIRAKTENLDKDFQNIEVMYKRFAKIYKNFNPPKIYFTIGNLKGGGTVIGGDLIIGSELAASDATVDYSELPKTFQDRMKMNSGITFLTTHELVHTQQHLDDSKKVNLLGLCLKEGSADFMTELLTRKAVEAPYIEYGLKNKCTLLKDFYTEKDGFEYENWLFNTSTVNNKPADLGYFVGYIITKNYYEKSKDKKEAIHTILNLDFSDDVAINSFLDKSGSMPCKFN